jgi:hypothetical protein
MKWTSLILMIGLSSAANAQSLEETVLDSFCIQGKIEGERSIGVTVLTSDEKRYEVECKGSGAKILKAIEVQKAKEKADKDKAAWDEQIAISERLTASHKH